MKKVSAVYKIKNKLNGMLYIGSAVDVRERFTRHRSALRGNYHHCRHLQNAWNKYGGHCFSFSIIIELETKKALLDVEQSLMDDYASQGRLYNINPKAISSLGRKHTQKSKDLIAKSKIGNKNSLGTVWKEEARENQAKKLTGNENRSGKWKVKTPEMKEEIIVKNLKKYCRENGLEYSRTYLYATRI